MTVKEELHVLIESLNDAEAVEALDLLRSVVTANGNEEEIGVESAGPAKPVTPGKPLWGIAGIGSSAEPTNVAKLKDEYLAEETAAILERAKPITADDPLWNIVGIGDSGPDGPTDVARNKHKYLAEAYEDRHEQ